MNVQPNSDSLLTMKRPQPQPRRMSRVVWIIAVAAIVALGFVAVRYLYPRPVHALVLRPANLTAEFRGPGTLEATNRITVSTPIQGRLTDVTVDRNDVVTKGQLLARLESSDLASELDAARASARAAAQAVGAAKADRERAVAAFVNAKATHDRQISLVAEGAASQTTVDAAIAALRQAEADLTRADRTIDQTQAEAQSAAAKVDVAASQLDQTSVRAPFAGMVVSRDRNVGDILTAGSSMLQLVDPATIVLTARFDESAIASMKPGQAVKVSFASQPRDDVTGHVVRLGRLVDAETREFTVDIGLGALPANWALGQRGTARVFVETIRDVLAVPKTFVTRRDGQAGIWILRGGRARWCEVELGESGDDRVEIRRGLETGETVLNPDGIYAFMKARLPGGSS